MVEDQMVNGYRSIQCSQINPQDLTKGQPRQMQVHVPIAHCKARGYETQMRENSLPQTLSTSSIAAPATFFPSLQQAADSSAMVPTYQTALNPLTSYFLDDYTASAMI
jgi:hypothetical protein